MTKLKSYFRTAIYYFAPGYTFAHIGPINETRLAILKLLEQHKFLTTSQIRRELAGPPPPLRSVQHALSRLRALGMVGGFAVEPELGRSSELCWQLRPAGSRLIGVVHNSHYSRRPTRERIRFRGQELEIRHQTEQAGSGGWQLVAPATHSPGQTATGHHQAVRSVDRGRTTGRILRATKATA